MNEEDPKNEVIIVGAGPSGLAISATLTKLSIRHTILERQNCFASLWQNHSYEAVKFHLPKQFCDLPHLPFPDDFPRFVPKDLFSQYLSHYVEHFNIRPLYGRTVVSASFDGPKGCWAVKAQAQSGHFEWYYGGFLVVASGETSDPFVPQIEGLEGFSGEIVHSTWFKNGIRFKGKRVLVVGSGNSGMEISLILVNHGAQTSIIVRSPVHVLSRNMVHLGLVLLKYLSCGKVDYLMVMFSKLFYGNLTKHGIRRPKEGPFSMKVKYGKYPIIDVGTIEKIKTGHIQVLQDEIENINNNNNVLLKNGKSYQFDAIVFCTGFKRSTHLWLKGDDYLLNDDGIPKPSYPNHWKGKNGLYCVGLSRRGFYGAKSDAINIANHIESVLRYGKNDI